MNKLRQQILSELGFYRETPLSPHLRKGYWVLALQEVWLPEAGFRQAEGRALHPSPEMAFLPTRP